ncbi:hypothetical protein ERJ75_001709000 [Trypanosoma vivax]|nr:hypothetical protein ERJ75_001709000 [Trypanosoma vivax]
MVKRLNVVNDTFTAPVIIANHVTAVETCMSKFVGRLSERAKALSMNHLTVDGMKRKESRRCRGGQRVFCSENIAIVAKDDARNGLRALLGNENGLSYR